MCRQVAHDLRTDLPEEAPPVSVGADSILLFEGLFLFRRGLNAYWDFRILLDVDPETSLSRALKRDVVDPADIVRRKYELRYEPAWQMYVREEDPASKADVILDNRDFTHPAILKPAGLL
jgi:uridine kinase